jgi:Na+-transporting NADH:ubiquinone oxidoreductase subunit NqrB
MTTGFARMDLQPVPARWWDRLKYLRGLPWTPSAPCCRATFFPDRVSCLRSPPACCSRFFDHPAGGADLRRGLATQAFWLKRLGLQRRGILSAVVTCCGLSLLLRSDTLWVHPLVAAFAMSSKFVLRIHGKHLFNPANLGVIAGIALLPGTWVSPGQWGNDLALAVWFLVLGTMVTQRARRLDISWVFLGAFLGLVALRVLLLGQSWTIWWHQLGNGALLLFAFFMISDPMTIPNRREARIVYALIVAVGAVVWQYVLFRPNALIWSLFLLSPLVPLFDRWMPGAGFE